MGRIFKEIGLLGSTNQYKKLRALFDTGATYNYISEKFSTDETIDDIGIMEYLGREPVFFPTGDKVDNLQIIKLKLLKIEGVPIEQPEFRILNMKPYDETYDVIIGAKLMQQLNIVLKPVSHEIFFC